MLENPKLSPNDIAEKNNWISQSNKDDLSEIIEKIFQIILTKHSDLKKVKKN